MIGNDPTPELPMEGSLPPDLQGTFLRAGPVDGEEADDAGVLHAVELRDGKAVSYLRRDSVADQTVFWHAGSVLALPTVGLPSRYTRGLEPEPFTGGLTRPIASHTRHVATDGARLVLSIDDDDIVRIGEWDARGALASAQAVQLDRSTWKHDFGVTAAHVVFVESPTRPIEAPATVPFGWDGDAGARVAVVPRHGDGSEVRWFPLDPCLVTHVLGAHEVTAPDAEPVIELYVCRYEAPETGQIDATTSIIGSSGVGLGLVNGGLARLERWRVERGRLRREPLDERHVEYPRMDPRCDGIAFRHGYCIETASPHDGPRASPRDEALSVGLLKFDLAADTVTSWRAAAGCRPSEPLFVRADDGHGDDEGWLLIVVDDPDRGASDLYVLDASSLGRRHPEAVVHLPARLPLTQHGEWVPADAYG